MVLTATTATLAAEEAITKDLQIQELEKRIAVLEQRLQAAEGAGPRPCCVDRPEQTRSSSEAVKIDELQRRIEILTREIELLHLGEAALLAAEGEHGLGPAASKVYATPEGLSIGGYGEMLYQEPDSDEGAQLDFLRAVFYFGYKFNDQWLFNSEIEIEHATTGESGSVSAEFAYLDYLHSAKINARFGLVLVPMGLVNELHEPPVFLGARRPDIEQILIPTTWREGGIGLFGDLGVFTYRTYIINGLDASGFSAKGLRGGRQKGSKAKAKDFAWVGRLDYIGTPGLLAGVSLYKGDSGQGLGGPHADSIDASTTIWEGHVEWKKRGFELRGLAAAAQVDDAASLNAALGLEDTESIGKELQGWYIQAGYDLSAAISSLHRPLIPYVRREAYDTQASVPSGFLSNPANDVESWTFGLAFKPLDQLIFKADVQTFDNAAGTATNQFNLAMGFLF